MSTMISAKKKSLSPALVYGGIWAQETQLTANDARPHSVFGSSVSLEGNSALIEVAHERWMGLANRLG